jgi:hypothetical protein
MKEALNAAESKLRAHRGSEVSRLAASVLAARIEVLRDQLERGEAEGVRGQLRECRYFMKLLTE